MMTLATYLARRCLGLLPVFLGVTLVTFFVIHLAPGKPSQMGGELNPRISLETRMRLEKLYDLDKPLLQRYAHWLIRMIRFDFGLSFSDGQPVVAKIAQTLPVTLLINSLSLVLIFLWGVPLGVHAAVHRHCWTDRLLTIFSLALFAAPTFWLALLAMNLLSVHLRWLPVSGLTGLDHDYLSWPQKILDMAGHLLLPVTISSLTGIAVISRYSRQNMTETLRQKYILAARARGLPERQIVYGHALRNSLLPVITLIGLSIPSLVGGSVIFESIFAIPGTGRLFFNSVMARDYPVIMGLLVLSAFLTLAGNLISDLAYAWVDPRIRDARQLKKTRQDDKAS